jgi:proline racemase
MIDKCVWATRHADHLRRIVMLEPRGHVTPGRTVSFVNVPSFVLFGGLSVRLENRNVRVDVAFGGAFYAIVDSEAAGLGIETAYLPELRRVGMKIARAVDAAHRIEHPLEPRLTGVEGTIFTGPPSDQRADLRSVTVFANAEVDRSPSGTAMSAVMAVLKAMGLLSDNATFLNEGLIGTLFRGRVTGGTVVGEHEAILPEIEGAAFITGEHTFIVEDDDPQREGFLL